MIGVLLVIVVVSIILSDMPGPYNRGSGVLDVFARDRGNNKAEEDAVGDARCSSCGHIEITRLPEWCPKCGLVWREGQAIVAVKESMSCSAVLCRLLILFAVGVGTVAGVIWLLHSPRDTSAYDKAYDAVYYSANTSADEVYQAPANPAIQVVTPTPPNDRLPQHVVTELLRKAEQGDAWAQNDMGIIYSNAGNHTESFKWYRKAAGAGIAQSQYNLGLKYAKGQGVPLDYIEAITWWQVAEQGDDPEAASLARHNLLLLRDLADKRMGR